jgi:hypothetical protein
MRRTNTKSTNAAGEPVREFELELMAWVVGDMQIPPIEVTYAYKGTVHRIHTKPVPIRVISMIGDGEEKLRDIAPPVSVEREDYTLLYIIIGLVVAILGALFRRQLRRWVNRWVQRLFFRKRRRRRRGPVATERPLGPAEEALVALDQLEQSEALTADDRQPFYVELSVIVRRYLGRRFQIRALDLTTGEVKRRLGGLPEGPQVIDLLGDLLDHADLVKYANYGASEEDARVAIAEARTLVEQTRYQMHVPAPTIPPMGTAVAGDQHWGPAAQPSASSTLTGMGAVSDTIVDSEPDQGGPDVS